MSLSTIIGITGSVIVLIAFLLTQFHEWKGDYLIYELCNFVGCVLLVIYSVMLGSYPFVILNAVWGGVAFWYMLMCFRRNSHRRDRIREHRRTFFEKWME